MAKVTSNREFLLLVENTFCSPNGNPDDDNRPRMNYKKDTALSSDVRIKRDSRNYLSTNKITLFVDRVGNKNVTANQMVLGALEEFENKPDLLQDLLTEDLKKKIEDPANFLQTLRQAIQEEIKRKQQKTPPTAHTVDPVLAREFLKKTMSKYFYDIKLFGATLTVASFNETITGPIQINWGESLNKVQLIESVSITTRFASGEDKSAGSMGKKYQVYYALIPFYGTISKVNAQETDLSTEDIQVFRESLVQGVLLPTGSKLGRMPIFYLEIEYKNNYNGLLGNLSRFINVKPDDVKIRSFKEIEYLDFTGLIDALKTIKNGIKKIHVWNHPVITKYYSVKYYTDNQSQSNQNELKLANFIAQIEKDFNVYPLNLFVKQGGN